MNKYNKMLNSLKSFRLIIVSGPQRSGTTFAAKCIAEDTDRKYIDENDIGIDDREKFRNVLKTAKHAVLQCPACSAYLVDAKDYRDIAIVFMIRPIEDIELSQKRINWNEQDYEKSKYGHLFVGPVSEFKYYMWRVYQKPQLNYVYELNYEDMKSHKRFISKNKRLKFDRRQTSLDNSW